MLVTTRGVISTISSVRFLLLLVVPNNQRKPGMRPRYGTVDAVSLLSCLISPPSNTVCPLCTATWVDTERVEIRGLPLLSTQVAVQNGQTVLLGGLIKQDNSDTASTVPYLGRIPGLRWLFGTTSKSKKRTELIVLITPRVVTSNSQARQVTDDYRQQLQLIKPTQ